MSVQGHNIRVGKVEIYAEEQGTAISTFAADVAKALQGRGANP